MFEDYEENSLRQKEREKISRYFHFVLLLFTLLKWRFNIFLFCENGFKTFDGILKTDKLYADRVTEIRGHAHMQNAQLAEKPVCY